MDKRISSKRKNKKIKKNHRRLLELIIVSCIIFLVFSARAQYDNIFSSAAQSNNDIAKEPPATTVAPVSTVQEKYNNEQVTGAINNIVASYKEKYPKSKISVIYNDLKSGYRYAHNDQEYFYMASTTKVLYAMDFYNRINKGELTLKQAIPYKSNHLAKGNGKITNNTKKKSYELDYVLMNMLTYSDNTATNMLLENDENTINIVNRALSDLGTKTDQILLKDNRLQPASMEKVWKHLYDNKDKYSNMLEYLKQSSSSEWIKEGIKNKTIASKYGQIPQASNDTAIVYGGKGDYLLLIYTEGIPKPGEVIPNIATQIDKLHEEKSN